MNSTTVIQHMYEAFDRGDMESGLAFLDENTVWEMTIVHDVPEPGIYRGREGVRRDARE